MTALVDQAVAALRTLPQVTQEELARFMLALAKSAPGPLPENDAAALAEANAQIARGQLTAPEAVRELWRMVLHSA